jgi:hypothetical protein
VKSNSVKPTQPLYKSQLAGDKKKKRSISIVLTISLYYSRILESKKGVYTTKWSRQVLENLVYIQPTPPLVVNWRAWGYKRRKEVSNSRKAVSLRYNCTQFWTIQESLVLLLAFPQFPFLIQLNFSIFLIESLLWTVALLSSFFLFYFFCFSLD